LEACTKPCAHVMSEESETSIKSRFKRWMPPLTFLCLLGVSYLFYNTEPRHGGRRFSAWMTFYEEGISPDRAQSAIYAMGTDAVPHLTSRLRNRSVLLRRLYESNPFVAGLMDRFLQYGQRSHRVHPQAMIAEDLLLNAPKAWGTTVQDSMMQLLTQGQGGDQITSLRILEPLNPDPELMIPILKSILQQKNTETAKAVLEFIRKQKWEAKPFENELITLFNHPDLAIQDKALLVATFGKMDAAKAMPALKLHLDTMPGSHKKRMAIQLLSSIALPDPKHIQYLEDGLDDPSDEVRRYSVLGLGRLGEPALGSLDDMLPLLSDENFGVRMSAADAIGDLGSGATKAIPHLIRSLNNDFSGIGQHCRRAIEKIDPEQAKNIMIR
jgi:hypothetical protein